MTTLTDIRTPDQSPEDMAVDARYYLWHLNSDEWYRIDTIPLSIRRQVIEILTTGKSGRRRVFENDDWTAFKLVPGTTSIPKYTT